MRHVIGFFRFWYDFIVGDDWTVGASVVGALVVTSVLAHRGVNAWWAVPSVVALVLAASLWAAVRRSHHESARGLEGTSTTPGNKSRA